MGFLFPLYLLGALAVAIPIALHLRRRPPKDRVVFSSLMFLDPQTPLKKRRSKLENLLLLALRCLALALLALLFSRPFMNDRNAIADASAGSTRVILIDRSASMKREGLWEEMKLTVEAAALNFRPEDRVALIAFDSQPEVLLGFEQWSNLPSQTRTAVLEETIEATEPSWMGTALDLAIVEAIGLIEDETKGADGQKELILVSDLQEGAARTGLENFAWPEDIQLQLDPVTVKENTNAAAHLVAQIEAEDGEAPEAVALRVRVSNATETTTENFKLGWAGDDENALAILLPPGATRVVSAPPRPAKESAFLELKGDTESFDNRIYVAPPQARPVDVLFLGEGVDSADTRSPLFYLERALSPTDTLAPSLKIIRPSEATPEDLLTADVIMVQSAPTAEQEAALKTFLESGGVVFLPLSKSTESISLLKELGMKTREAEVDDYVMLEGIDFEHPTFRPFAAPGLRDFSKIHFWKYREIELDEEATQNASLILAHFDAGTPALIESRVGKGRVFTFASDWVPSESQLALSSKFVPLLYSMMQVAGFDSDAKRQFYVGDTLPTISPEATVIGPDGDPATLEARKPGVYTIKDAGENLRYAVNLPFEESRLDPLPKESFTTLGIALTGDENLSETESAALKVQLESVELEEQQKLWKWLILGVIGLLLAETWLANRAPQSIDEKEPA